MTFTVEPTDLRVFAATLARLAESSEIARGYANQIGSFSLLENGILGELHGRHAEFLAELNQTMQRMMELLDASSLSVQAVATAYEQTDLKSAAEIDSSYPAAQRPINPAGA
ncbi:type VII secretion target [Actinoplanes sp. NPDC026670]|uniref:type VII secretion target n=1 Tax=Actinoplanes sp. NPDC026670 TaxID=3154700 RepID=UPI0033EED432